MSVNSYAKHQRWLSGSLFWLKISQNIWHILADRNPKEILQNKSELILQTGPNRTK